MAEQTNRNAMQLWDGQANQDQLTIFEDYEPPRTFLDYNVLECHAETARRVNIQEFIPAGGKADALYPYPRARTIC